MNIDAAIRRRELPPQNKFRHLLARYNPACRPQQQFQKIELQRGELYFLARLFQAAVSCVKFQIVQHNPLGFAIAAWPAKNCSDAHQEFTGTKRLGNIIIRAHFETHDFVDFLTPRREHQYPRVRFAA